MIYSLCTATNYIVCTVHEDEAEQVMKTMPTGYGLIAGTDPLWYTEPTGPTTQDPDGIPW